MDKIIHHGFSSYGKKIGHELSFKIEHKTLGTLLYIIM